MIVSIHLFREGIRPVTCSGLFRKVFCVHFISLFITFSANASEIMTTHEAVTQPQLAADYRFNYGPDTFQFGDLRLPAGHGPHPVVIIIHGGCWSARYGLHLMDAMAERLRNIGFASWNVEFRRVGQAGGGWPGTFVDVLLAARYVENLATRFDIDLKNMIITGHSSGGHLALWLANEFSVFSSSSYLLDRKPTVRGVVALAPVTDLLDLEGSEGAACRSSLEDLMGGTSASFPQRYIHASPAQMPVTAVPLTVFSGEQDHIIPVQSVEQFALISGARGSKIHHVILKQSGHFEMITPATTVWPEVESHFRRFLELQKRRD